MSQPKPELTYTEWSTIGFALEVAAARYHEDAEQATAMGVSGKRIAERFTRQEEKARELHKKLSDADLV